MSNLVRLKHVLYAILLALPLLVNNSALAAEKPNILMI